MTAKITLYSEDKLIRDVKNFAKEHNTSVSKLVSTFFYTLLNDADEKKSTYKITNSLLGVLKDKTITEEDYKKYREDKYL
ncbi:hypothetical protein JHD50_05150 [Sulfurimonas sp. MAG313]|nr:DUF6364 family protein [Sulfurimonas sp. MAG313]MDF1880695.1 hypothetical protein [Sulfurimonas sp. MAG313]